MSFTSTEPKAQSGHAIAPPTPFSTVADTLDLAAVVSSEIQELVNKLLGAVPQAVESSTDKTTSGILNNMAHRAEYVGRQLRDAQDDIQRLRNMLP